ncbi:MAG: amidohydrolase family protein [Chitinophagales bacterium]|nr:amidohydrolase family protein [Chitinophagales bacterium]
MRHLFAAFLLLSAFALSAQTTFPVNGVQDKREGAYALVGANIYVDYKTVLDSATLLIRDGKIEAVGKGLKIPSDAVLIDAKGLFIYPAFIDLYTEYGLAALKRPDVSWEKPQMESLKDGAYNWNQAIKPETNALELFKVNNDAAEALRNIGFATVLTHQNDGIARGTGTLVSLANDKESQVVIKDVASSHYSFNKGVSTQDYPSSLMGAIALLRQTYLDAQWYKAGGNKKEYNISLDEWNKQQALPKIFEVNSALSILRADKLGDEFGLQYIIKGNGEEYQRIEEIKATGANLIIPLNFPKPFDVEDPFDAQNVSLSEMKHWELAPANPALLEQAGINFAITSAGLANKSDFLANMKKSVQYGLSKETALKALTFTPADILKVYDKVGSLEKGKVASFLVASGDLFSKDSRILETWCQGKKYQIGDKQLNDIRGKYDIVIDNKTYLLEVAGKIGSPDAKLKTDTTDSVGIKVTLVRKGNLVSLSYNFPKDSSRSTIRLSGLMEAQSWTGTGELADGRTTKWTARLVSANEPKPSEQVDSMLAEPPGKKDIIYPFMAYGYQQVPKKESVLFKNVTVWTNTDKGILQQTDVYIENGKIAAIGKGLGRKADQTIDGNGKHLTSGIIDEHSHIAISSGVNEGTQASSAEVRIGDVVNSEDINIYRQLAGGVTTAQLLHGSANPIGGQSAIIKLRWGFSPEKMKFEGADGFIKFALGENVKQSNWGDYNTIRFPQTRMGVEQVYEDYFTQAKQYGDALKSKDTLLRRNLDLEAGLEILNKKRFITCHSYVQSEINMLMKVAEKHGFRVNTFTHILEGYKVADKMKAHGVNASTFADWWAYKYEVIEAIPYNAAILTEVGVNTGINSDDAEMGRRLNQEAAKAIKYGGLSEEEAWKLVTLNPAKMLHIDNRVGSVSEGKDADIVLWSDNPLSIYAKPLQTYVDGICFYDSKKDKELRLIIQTERARLIQKMLAAKAGGAETQKPVKKSEKLYHCDDMDGYEDITQNNQQ